MAYELEQSQLMALHKLKKAGVRFDLASLSDETTVTVFVRKKGCIHDYDREIEMLFDNTSIKEQVVKNLKMLSNTLTKNIDGYTTYELAYLLKKANPMIADAITLLEEEKEDA